MKSLYCVFILILFVSCNNKPTSNFEYHVCDLHLYELDTTSHTQSLDVIINKESLDNKAVINQLMAFGIYPTITSSGELTGLFVLKFDILSNSAINYIYKRNFDSYFIYRNSAFCFKAAEFYNFLLPSNRCTKFNVAYETNSIYYQEPYEWLVEYKKDSVLINLYSSIEAGIIEFDTVLTKVNPGNASNKLVE